MSSRSFHKVVALCLAFAFAGAAARTVDAAGTMIKNICRVKGQEENTLRGLGLVVGLNGTGEAGDEPTMRALARSLEIMGHPLGQGGLPTNEKFDQLRRVKNVALVMVTAVVPATGARRGDKLDCSVAGLTGKSLQGGRLALAALQGPNTQDARVYALCQGPIHIDDPASPLVGTVHNGTQVEQDILNPFQLDGYVNLVLRSNHADFDTANEIAILVGTQLSTEAKALDAANVEIKIPDEYQESPAEFVAAILEQRVYIAAPEARVVVNERTGSVVISGDVEIGAVVVTHRNLVVEAGPTAGRFVSIDPEETNPTKLEALLNALNALKVPPQDVIAIIKGIDRSGKLHGRLIVE